MASRQSSLLFLVVAALGVAGDRVSACSCGPVPDFALPPGTPLVTLGGVVLDISGKPQEGATVGVYHDDEQSQSASVMTNEQGEFRITVLPRGRYRLRASMCRRHAGCDAPTSWRCTG